METAWSDHSVVVSQQCRATRQHVFLPRDWSSFDVIATFLQSDCRFDVRDLKQRVGLERSSTKAGHVLNASALGKPQLIVHLPTTQSP